MQGITPLQFAEMTHKEIGEYIQAQVRRREATFKEQAILLDGLFRQWAATQAKRPKAIGPKDLYPTLFEEQKQELSPQQAQKLAADRWRLFLGI